MTIKEDVEELKKLVEAGALKEKKHRYPFGKKVGKSQKKKNYITIELINENGTVDFKKYQIIDQTVMHDTVPRLAAAGHILRDRKGNPLIILPNWSVEPFSPLEHYNKSMVNGSNAKGYKLLMARMQSEKVETKKNMAGWIKWVIGLALLGIIIFAIVTGGGGA